MGGCQRAGMLHRVKPHKPPEPTDVRFLGPSAVATQAQYAPELTNQRQRTIVKQNPNSTHGLSICAIWRSA